MASPRLRPALPDDYPAFVRFFAELGVPDPVPPRERWAQYMLPTTGFLEQDGALVGYAFWEAQSSLGYVRHVVVAPDQRGRRLGYALMAALKYQLLEQGCTRWCLNVKDSNTSARRLYAGVGMLVSYATQVLRLEWRRVSQLPTPASGVVAHPLSPNDDRDVEEQFGLGPGSLGTRRQRPGSVVASARITSDSSYVGLAVFDPNFPGAFPFRASTPGAARALLELLERHRHPEHPELQLVIEDDALLNDALMGAGARQLFELVHMTGELAAGSTPAERR